MEIIWRDICGYEGLYQVSNTGLVRNIRHNKNNTLNCNYWCKNRARVALSKNGKVSHLSVARLVAFAFPEICGEWFEGAVVNHLDENPSNDCASNLRWVTPCDNNTWGTRIERVRNKCYNGKLSKPIVQYDLNLVVIKEWPSGKEIERQLGYSGGNISKVCLGKYKTAYGYIWKYKETA